MIALLISAAIAAQPPLKPDDFEKNLGLLMQSYEQSKQFAEGDYSHDTACSLEGEALRTEAVFQGNLDRGTVLNMATYQSTKLTDEQAKIIEAKMRQLDFDARIYGGRCRARGD